VLVCGTNYLRFKRYHNSRRTLRIKSKQLRQTWSNISKNKAFHHPKCQIIIINRYGRKLRRLC